MKTGLFSTIATSVLLLASVTATANDSRSSAHKMSVSAGNGVDYPHENDRYEGSDYGPTIRTDTEAYDWGDQGTVAFAAPDGSSYSYDGEWDGEFVDPQGRVFEGEWQGTVTRHNGVSGPGYPALPQYRRQAGPHHPVPMQHASKYEDDYDGYRGPQDYSRQNYAWQGGYYYYPQAPMVTVIVGSGASHTTTTVTEEVFYETVHSAPRKRFVRKWKPRPKPRCVC